MPNSTTALKLIVAVKMTSGSELTELTLAIVQSVITRNNMYASLDLICVAPSIELYSSAAVTLMVYDMAQLHRVAFKQINLMRSADPRIVSLTPSVAPINSPTAVVVEIESFSQFWVACELAATFVGNYLQMPAKILLSSRNEERAHLTLLTPILLEAHALNVQLQCGSGTIISATTVQFTNPARLSVLSFSPTSVSAAAGGVLLVLLQSSIDVLKFTASVSVRDYEQQFGDIQVEVLPNFMFRIQILMDPISVNVASGTAGIIRIVPDSRFEQSGSFQIMFSAVQVSIKSILPSQVYPGLKTPVIAELLNVPQSASSDLLIKSQQTLIELPEIISCNPWRCIYKFIIDLPPAAVRGQLDLSFSFSSLSGSNSFSQTILVKDTSVCNVIDVVPSMLTYNRINDVVIRVSAISMEFFDLRLSFGVRENVGKRSIKNFGTSVLLAFSVTVSSMSNAWLQISDKSCSANVTFLIQPIVNASIIQVTPSLVSSGQTVIVDLFGYCPDTSGVYVPLLQSFQLLSFTARNLTESLCSVILVMPSFQIASEIWLNFSHVEYAISASIFSVSGCSDRASLAAFCSSIGQVVNIFSNFRGLVCQQSGCLNPLEVPNQITTPCQFATQLCHIFFNQMALC